MHLGHFVTTLGERFDVQALTLEELQRHVDKRAKKRYRGRPLSPVTLRKEMATLRACWNWGVHGGKLKGSFPSRDLKYPKGEEKPPFQTWAEIERRVALGGISAREQEELWECLFLTLPGDRTTLGVRERERRSPVGLPGFLLRRPHRRSEILRVKTFDVDFTGETVIIHEKKRARGKRTTRRVPLSRSWPGSSRSGSYPILGPGPLLPRGGGVRQQEAEQTTGHQNEKVRPSSLKGRLATVRRRERPRYGADHQGRSPRPFRADARGRQVEGAAGLACPAPQLHLDVCGEGGRSAAHRRLGRSHHGGDEEALPGTWFPLWKKKQSGRYSANDRRLRPTCGGRAEGGKSQGKPSGPRGEKVPSACTPVPPLLPVVRMCSDQGDGHHGPP